MKHAVGSGPTPAAPARYAARLAEWPSAVAFAAKTTASGLIALLSGQSSLCCADGNERPSNRRLCDTLAHHLRPLRLAVSKAPWRSDGGTE
jgi:hypothetical protein